MHVRSCKAAHPSLHPKHLILHVRGTLQRKKHSNHKATGVNNRLRNACDERSISFINHNGNIKADHDLNLLEILAISYWDTDDTFLMIKTWNSASIYQSRFSKRDAMASELKKDKNAVNLFFLIQLLKKNVLPRKLRIRKVK